MTISLIIAVLLYLACLFALAWSSKKNRLPPWLTSNPVAYVLALGISLNTWSIYGAVGTAAERGYAYLAYYVGYAVAFLFAMVFLMPILRITRTYQLSSMADLFSFRFRSPLAGTLTTVVLLISVLPLLALQILAVGESARILLPGTNTALLALGFCVLVLGFAIIFGSSEQGGRDRHRGLVAALAFEGLFKLAVLAGLGLFAVFGVFGGPGEMNDWLTRVPAEVTRLELPYFERTTNLVMLLYFTAAVAMPHMFHMTFKENSNSACLRAASWGLPLLLLLAALPVLPVLWAGEYLGSGVPAEYLPLALGLLMDAPWLSVAVFTAGLAAAFGIMAVIALAMANMCLNHVILPLYRPGSRNDLYDWLLFYRRLLMGAVIGGSYFCYRAVEGGNLGMDVGYVSFTASAQFLPGIIALLFWPAGNRKGFIAGLCAGLAVWFSLGLLPLFQSDAAIPWDGVLSLSLVANLMVMIGVSLSTETSEEEGVAGEMCTMDNFRRPRRLQLAARTPLDFIDALAEPLGYGTARREVLRAMKDLEIRENESRPYPIQQLRDRLEANLSGLLGPTIANEIIKRNLAYELVEGGDALDVSYIESRLEAYPGNLTGVAVDLDNLRRHHRQVLRDLPIGVCSLGPNQEITLWNGALERLTGLPANLISGSRVDALPEPWKTLLAGFIADEASTHIHKKSLIVNDRHYWVGLHKATIEKSGAEVRDEGLVIVVEDLTETELLEAELTHAERLASIGRLAAGVAHEIGNPITGIACLAQNIRDETGDGELRQMAEQIIEQTRRASRIVQSLVNFSHGGTRHRGGDMRAEVDVRECAEEAIQLICLNRNNLGVRFSNQCRQGLILLTDRQRLQQIFVNLLTNARDASEPGAAIVVTDSISEEKATIMITDQGQGIPAEVRDRIFEPFFTTKEPGKGTGLGLSLVYSITEDLGGGIQVESPVDKVSRKGTRVSVTFPFYHGNIVASAESSRRQKTTL